MSILLEAHKLVHGDRQKTYGHPLDNWTDIAERWGRRIGEKLTAEQAILCMIDLKLARQDFMHNDDNIRDIAGYCEVLSLVRRERAARNDQKNQALMK